MRAYSLACLAAGLWIAASAMAFAQEPNESAQQNVRESEQYEQLLCTNQAFRARRMAQECGPLQGSQFYQSCLASFNCNRQPSAGRWRQVPASERIR